MPPDASAGTALRAAPSAAFVRHCLAGVRASLRLTDHQIDFLPGGRILVVTFEPAAIGKAATGKDANDLARPVWGQAFLQRRGHAVLGVKRVAADWYRSADLHQVFRALQLAEWFGSFDQVVFYGPSMGGYAALAFSACVPGSTVLALNPQSTLAPDRAWFDQRYADARSVHWTGDFVDGADGAATARRVYVCYDPYQVKDRLHADRLPSHNRINLRLPFVGHTTAQALNGLGLLGVVFDGAVQGTLDEAGFRRLARARTQWADYHVRMAERGVWLPRRVRYLAQGLAIDPRHPRAAALSRSLTEQASASAPTHASDLPDTPAHQPKVGFRWPMGLVTAPRMPLIYLNVPKCASTTVQNHLLYLAAGAYSSQPQDIHQHPGLLRSRENRDETHELISRHMADGAFVFTFVRDPGHRAYACFNEKIVHGGRHSFAAIRQALEREWGLNLPRPGEPVTLERHRDNFAAFLRFVEANLAGDTSIRRDPHWCPQGPMLVHYRKHLKIDLVGKVENFEADMALVLHRAGARRAPDLTRRPWRHAQAPFSFEELLTPALQAQLDRLYEADYVHLGYRRAS